MFEQLNKLVQEFGNESVVKNNAIPNEQNEAVMNEASNSILSGLQKMVSEGGVEQLADLFNRNNAQTDSNPIAQQLTEQLTGKLGAKFGLSNEVASGVAGGMIPKILASLIGKAKDPNDSSLNISDLVNAISGGSGQNALIMDAISKYGGQFGLDQNADGKVDMSDAIDPVTKNSGGVGGILGKLFGK